MSFSATVTDADHAAPEWALTLHLRGPAQIDLTAAPDGTGHKFTATPAETAEWAAGTYWWAIRATDGLDVVQLDTGEMIVLPDLAAVTDTYDGRSEAARALDAIEAVLAKRATLDQERYRINNRELYRTPIADLIKLRSYYVAQVRRERARGKNSGWGRAVHVRFS